MFIQNKYTTVYYQIIKKATQRDGTEYTEKHHIVPRSLGGNNSKDNIVKLTPREHFICHWLLSKMTTDKNREKMIYALQMMQKSKKHTLRYDTKITSRVFERIRIESNRLRKNKIVSLETRLKMSAARKKRIITDETRKKLSESALRRGKRGPMSEETKSKIATANTGKYVSPETKNRMSLAATGKPKSEAHKANMSIAHQQRKYYQNN